MNDCQPKERKKNWGNSVEVLTKHELELIPNETNRKCSSYNLNECNVALSVWAMLVRYLLNKLASPEREVTSPFSRGHQELALLSIDHLNILGCTSKCLGPSLHITTWIIYTNSNNTQTISLHSEICVIFVQDSLYNCTSLILNCKVWYEPLQWALRKCTDLNVSILTLSQIKPKTYAGEAFFFSLSIY